MADAMQRLNGDSLLGDESDSAEGEDGGPGGAARCVRGCRNGFISTMAAMRLIAVSDAGR